MNALRRLTYRSDLLALARFLRLTPLLRKCYYQWTTSRGGILHSRICGIDVRFCARTPQELRRVEYNVVLEEGSFLSLLASTLHAGDVFFDVGSNIGVFAVIIAKVVGRVGRVFAFEPQTDFHRNLRENVELNMLSNVTMFKRALGESNTSGRLYVQGLESPSLVRGPHIPDPSFEHPEESPSGSTADRNAEVVEIVSGDWLRETQGLPVPRAVKIDVEGYEYSVLRGLERTLAHPGCELLCVEIHPSFLPPDATVEAIVRFVKSLGFTHLEEHPRLTQIHLVASKPWHSHVAA